MNLEPDSNEKRERSAVQDPSDYVQEGNRERRRSTVVHLPGATQVPLESAGEERRGFITVVSQVPTMEISERRHVRREVSRTPLLEEDASNNDIQIEEELP